MLKIKQLNFLVALGFIAIVGVLIMQVSLIKDAFAFEKKDFEQKIFFVLKDVLNKIHKLNNNELIFSNQIQKVSDDYYIVNVNDVFDNRILEYYLTNEFKKVKLDLDYEYAIYNCSTDKMVYGNYISSKKNNSPCIDCFKKDKNLIYYFGIRFPKLKWSVANSIYYYWIFAGILLIVLFIYVYSTYTLLQYQRLASLQKDFVNNMTHEFKTPLTSILIASKQIEQMKEDQKEKNLKYAQLIHQQAQKLNEHVEMILQVAQSEQQRKIIHQKPMDMVGLIQHVKDDIVSSLQKKAQIEISAPEKLMVLADEFHFYNVLYNLLDNAIKYVPEPILVEVKLMMKGNKYLLIITDNGKGVLENELPYLFDKFHRVQNEKTETIKGFGLGLFYVKKIVELHKWKIKAKNQTNKGLQFEITIPNKDLI